MALAQRVESLRKRHAEVDEELHREISRPSGDDLLINQLKREKLILKDELSRISPEQAESAIVAA